MGWLSWTRKKKNNNKSKNTVVKVESLPQTPYEKAMIAKLDTIIGRLIQENMMRRRRFFESKNLVFVPYHIYASDYLAKLEKPFLNSKDPLFFTKAYDTFPPPPEIKANNKNMFKNRKLTYGVLQEKLKELKDFSEEFLSRKNNTPSEEEFAEPNRVIKEENLINSVNAKPVVTNNNNSSMGRNTSAEEFAESTRVIKEENLINSVNTKPVATNNNKGFKGRNISADEEFTDPNPVNNEQNLINSTQTKNNNERYITTDPSLIKNRSPFLNNIIRRKHFNKIKHTFSTKAIPKPMPKPLGISFKQLRKNTKHKPTRRLQPGAIIRNKQGNIIRVIGENSNPNTRPPVTV